MAVFALLPFVPLLLYCLIQTVRDARRRRIVMAAYGGVMVALLLLVIGKLLAMPTY